MTLEKYLESRGLAASEFARQINVSTVTMWRYLREGRIPETPVLQRIIDATGGEVMPNDFFLRKSNGKRRK